ncbi:hypothetical protein V12B01_03508 [Vibrio splendidus 12B01]|nr:hypothetical protein V12B01_03508 [Vibrio splendidus 12B01]
MSVRIKGSSAENASSINRISGSHAKARARPTRCFIPPDNSSGYDSEYAPRPTRSNASNADCFRLSISTPASSRPNAAFSITVICGISAKFWKTMEMLLRRTSRSSSSEMWAMSLPRRSTLPLVGSIKRLRRRTRVDLPDPDNPIITKISPS